MGTEPFQLAIKEATNKAPPEDKQLKTFNCPDTKNNWEALGMPTEQTCTILLFNEKCRISVSTRNDWTDGKFVTPSSQRSLVHRWVREIDRIGSRSVPVEETESHYPLLRALCNDLSGRDDIHFAKCPPGFQGWRRQAYIHLFGQ